MKTTRVQKPSSSDRTRVYRVGSGESQRSRSIWRQRKSDRVEKKSSTRTSSTYDNHLVKSVLIESCTCVSVMVARRGSVSATGGSMLNPSVEPSARRESAQFRRDSATGKPQHPATRSIQDRGNGNDAGAGGSDTALSSASDAATSVAAVDARNQRRSIGLKVWLSIRRQFFRTAIPFWRQITGNYYLESNCPQNGTSAVLVKSAPTSHAYVLVHMFVHC